MKTGGNLRAYMRRTFVDAFRHPPALAAARFLATDPWFVRAACPDADAGRVAEAFVVPLVVLAALTVGLTLQPGTPVTDAELERLTGVPRIGEAFLAAKVVARDAHGFYDWSNVMAVVPRVTYDKAADDREYHARVRRAAAALGYRYDPCRPGRVTAFKQWAEAKGYNTTGLLTRLLKPEGIRATSEDGEPTERKWRRRKKAGPADGRGAGTAGDTGAGPEDQPPGP